MIASPETHRYALYRYAWGGHFSIPEGVYDTLDEALDAQRAMTKDAIESDRWCAVADPRELAIIVLPVARGAK